MNAFRLNSLAIEEPTTLADAARIADLYPGKTAEEKRRMVDRHLAPAFAASRAGRRTVLLARSGENVVGTVQVVWESDEDALGLHAPGAAVVHHLRTHPEYRRLGIGRRLLAEAEHLATERGVVAMTLAVEPENAAARRLYQTSRFRAVSTYRGSDGEPLIAMAKRLGAPAE